MALRNDATAKAIKAGCFKEDEAINDV